VKELKKRLIPLANALYNAIIAGDLAKVIGISETINIVSKQYKEDKNGRDK